MLHLSNEMVANAPQLVLMKQRLQKPLMRQLRSKKGQDKTLPTSLRMRYKAVAHKTRSACLGFRFAGWQLFAVADDNTPLCEPSS